MLSHSIYFKYSHLFDNCGWFPKKNVKDNRMTLRNFRIRKEMKKAQQIALLYNVTHAEIESYGVSINPPLTYIKVKC